MPIIKSAVKRMKQDAKRRARNISLKRDIKSASKAFLAKPTAEGLSKVQSAIDTAVKKNLLKKNTAARKKAQLSKVAKDAGVKLNAKAKAAPKKSATKKPATKSAAKKAPAKKPAAKKTPAKKTAKKS